MNFGEKKPLLIKSKKSDQMETTCWKSGLRCKKITFTGKESCISNEKAFNKQKGSVRLNKNKKGFD